MLPDKRSGTYSRLFSIINEIRPKCLHNLCIRDFETAIHAAYLNIFPQSSVGTCLFHLGQACWRKICALGDRLKYNTDAIFFSKMKCFLALAFLTTEDVASVFEELIDDDCISTEFILYFEYTYIGIARGRSNRRRRDNPLYPIEMYVSVRY